MPKVAALILSAGESKRMGSPKALLKLNSGKTLLEEHIKNIQNSGTNNISVVVGCHADETRSEHKESEVNWILNSSWEQGNFSSILTGLKNINFDQFDGVLLTPIDTVGVDADTIKTIVQEGVKTGSNIIPTFNDRGGHPVFISRQTHKWIVENCDNSNRLDVVLREAKETIRLPVNSPNIRNNINTPEEWNKYIAQQKVI